MDALDVLWQQWDDTAIVTDIVVVRTLTILGLATGNEVLHTERTITAVGHAVDDKVFYRIQGLHFVIFILIIDHGFNG